MKILEDYPPNFALIKQGFPMLGKVEPIFCYGEVIYNPFKVKITPDLEVHEETHSKRQGGFPDQWWYNYLNDLNFRLEEEVIAYGEQYHFIKQHMKGKLLEWGLDKMSEALSSELYNLGISYGQARSKIRNYEKQLNG